MAVSGGERLLLVATQKSPSGRLGFQVEFTRFSRCFVTVLGLRKLVRSILTILTFASLIAASSTASSKWSPRPWLDDLAQAEEAFATKYANIDWLEHDRGVPSAGLFGEAAGRLRSARSDEEAKAVFDQLVERVADGHVSIDWPRTGVVPGSSLAPSAKRYDICKALGFTKGRSSLGIAGSLSGYRGTRIASPFPAGILHVGAQVVGVVRIGGFEPQESPSICRAALQLLRRPAERPCDDACRDAILTWSYNRLTKALEEQVRFLQASGARVLLVDITSNEGGTEWAEAAARILSPKALTSEKWGFVRGEHWSAQWRALAVRLRAAAASANSHDRALLLGWVAEAERARTDAARQCPAARSCARVGRAGYATGLVGTAHAGQFDGKPWADLVFSIAQFPYRDSVWSGPLLVLVDGQTWSAAEEFAAVLQDNGAAVIVGTRTGGAGCGHTNGGTPAILKNSGATLELPDCVRYRADGSNEVAGISPDVPTGMKATDGPALKARLIEAHLPEAIRLATGRMRR